MPTCTLSSQEAPPLEAARPFKVNEDASCLIDPSKLGSSSATIFDTRSRADFLSFHIPDADHASVSALITRPGLSDKQLIVYDSGKFRSDAFLLCDRLRKAGLANVRVLNGGIVSWAQNQGHPNRLDLSRISDHDVAAMLSESATRAKGITESLKLVLQRSSSTLRTTQGPKMERIVLVADPAVSVPEIQSALDRQTTTAFYWLGTADQLSELLTRHLAQNEKRLAGPVESPICDSL